MPIRHQLINLLIVSDGVTELNQGFLTAVLYNHVK